MSTPGQIVPSFVFLGKPSEAAKRFRGVLELDDRLMVKFGILDRRLAFETRTEDRDTVHTSAPRKKPVVISMGRGVGDSDGSESQGLM